MNSIRQNFIVGYVKLGEFLLKGRREAAIAAMLTAAIPFLGWASLAIVAFITLRKGIREGLFVLAWSLIPALISGYLRDPSLAMMSEIFVGYFLVCGLSWLLRSTASWRYVLEVSCGVGIVIVLLFYWLIPDLNGMYARYLIDVYHNATTDTTSYQEAHDFIHQIVHFLLGVQVAFYVLHALLALFIARGLQALMFNSGGLSQDIKMIRLGYVSLAITIIFLFLGWKMSFDWALGTFPLFLVLYLLAGLSVIHYAIKQKIRFKGATLLFYIVFVLLLPFSVIPVIIFALIDSVSNFRRFLYAQKA